MKTTKTILGATALILTLSLPSFAGTITGSRTNRVGTITGSSAGTITGSRAGTITGSRAGTITGSSAGTITGSRSDFGSDLEETTLAKLTRLIVSLVW